MNGIAHGPATAASGAVGGRYSGPARSSCSSSPTVVAPSDPPSLAAVASGGYSRARSVSGSRPRGPWRPGSAVEPLPAGPPPSDARGTRSSGRDASIGVAVSCSVATTWMPAETSSPQPSRASPTRASSMVRLADRRADVVVDVRRRLLLGVPVVEAVVLDDLDLVRGRGLGLLGQDAEEERAGALDRDDVGVRADRG